MVPISLFANMTDTSWVFSVIAFVIFCTSIMPDLSGVTYVTVCPDFSSILHGSNTASCSIDVVTICPVPLITPCIAILFDSVPPDVNKISPGKDPISVATCLRAMFIVFSAARPYP